MRGRDGSVFFVELSKGKIQQSRNIVISRRSRGGYTMAQQVEVQEGKRTINLFMKDAFHIDDLAGLYNLRDALNVAIETEENKDEWDD